MAVSTAGLRKSFSGNWLSGSGMIQPFEANSAVQMTSMSMTSYSSLLAWRFATSWASWSLDASGSSSRVTFWLGYRLFHPAITPCTQPELSLPMARVIGPIPLVDGAEPPGEAPPDVQPAALAARRNPTATAAIPGIARRMRATTPPRPCTFVDACYAPLLDICQQDHVTTPTCFVTSAAGSRAAASGDLMRLAATHQPQGLTYLLCTAII